MNDLQRTQKGISQNLHRLQGISDLSTKRNHLLSSNAPTFLNDHVLDVASNETSAPHIHHVQGREFFWCATERDVRLIFLGNRFHQSCVFVLDGWCVSGDPCAISFTVKSVILPGIVHKVPTEIFKVNFQRFPTATSGAWLFRRTTRHFPDVTDRFQDQIRFVVLFVWKLTILTFHYSL